MDKEFHISCLIFVIIAVTNIPNGNILQDKWKKLFKIIVMFKNNYQVPKDQEAFYIDYHMVIKTSIISKI